MRPLLSLCLAIVVLLFANCALGAPAFTVTPSATSNAYTGFVTVAGTGLYTNETVIVRKYLDLNTNGVIDAGDLFLRQFQVTDNASATLIGGATNSNVPYDTNSTKGAISIPVSIMLGADSRLVGQYLYVFSSPSNHFTAITNSFTVTNANYAQTISGQVVSNSTPIPYTPILIGYAGGDGFSPFTGAVANSAGNYTVKVPPGFYQAVAFKTNFIGVPAGPFTVAASGSEVTNLSLLAATNSVSGRITDSANSSLGLPGLLITSQGNGIGLCSTDTNGNYSLPVLFGSQWKINGESASWDFAGYVQSNDSPKMTISGNISGFNLNYPRAESMIYGKVVDGNNNPLVGVRFYGDSGNGPFQGDATSDANGNYSMGLMAGTWDAEVDLGSCPPQYTNYVFTVPAFSYSSGGNGLALAAGTAYHQNFVGLLATNTISGFLKDNSSSPIAGVQINANVTVNGTNFSTQAKTDSNGFYSFNAANGTWDVFVNCCNGSCDSGLPSIYQCPNDQQTTVANNNKTVNFTVQRSIILSGKVTDNLGNPVSNVNIFAFYDGGGSSGGQTDGSGNYSIGVTSGSATVEMDTSASGISTLGLISPALQVTIGSSDIANFNLVCRQITGTIVASITNSSGPVGVSSVNVDAGCTLNGTNYDTGNQLTDGTGKVVLGVCDGSWAVTASCSDLSSLSLSCPANDGTSVNISGNSQTINYLVQTCSVQITTTNLPNGTNGVFYDAFLNGTACNLPLNWSYFSGNVPSGLSIGGNGEIAGTPSGVGTYTFSVQAQDQQFNTTITNVSITINAAATPLQVATFSLPNAQQGASYNASVSATGGTSPYHWQIELGSASPPTGINFGTNGVFSGTCTASANTYYFYVQVTDSLNNNADQLLSITVTTPPLLITTLSLPNGNLGAYYSNNIIATGGQSPYSWSLALGSASPPPGTLLTGSGTVAGTPTTAGSYAFRAQVNDNIGNVTNRLFQIVINPLPTLAQPVRLNPSQFQLHLNGSIGQNYTLQYSTTLSNWNSFIVTNPVSSDSVIIDPNATNLMRGYRALIGP